MPLVLDASVAGCWAFADETSACADLALDRAATEGALVPALWWFELRNLLLMSERRNRISITETALFLQRLAHLLIDVDITPDSNEVLRLARRHRLTIYDAAYLELATRRAADLATLDAALQKAATVEAITLL